MLLTADPTKAIKEPYQMVTVNYFATSVQKLYRIGTTGDWLNYNDQPIKVKQDETIYAKGIDQYGNETRVISTYTVNVVDALKLQAYDGNDATYVTEVSNQLMAVDSDMSEKNIIIKSQQNSSSWGGNGTIYVKFLDQNKTIISQYVKGTGTYSDTVLVPANTKWVSCSCITGYSVYHDVSPSYLYEIKVVY